MSKVIDLTEKLTAYGRYVIKAQAEAPDFDTSDAVTAEFVFGATISVSAGVLTITKCLEGVSQFEIQIDGEVVDTVDYDYSSDWSVDLSTLKDDTDKHQIAVRAIGDNISEDNLSNIVTAYTGLDTNIYGVSGLYSSTVALTRTDNAVGMSYTINSDGTINSDFDERFPWNMTQLVTDDYGNEFVAFPTMYFRVGYDSSYRITNVAVSAIAHDDGSTWYEVPAFWYGRYGGYVSSSKLCSKSGVTRTASTTRANFRTYAKNNGDGYHQLDLYHHTVLKFLWWIEWATKNSQSIMTGCISGTGTTAGSAAMATGGTDELATPSGYELTRHQMRYHYIEDFIGNYLEWLDGVYAYVGTSSYDYATADPSKFADSTSGLTKLCYPGTASGTYEVAAFGWDPSNPFLCTPRTSVTNTSYNTYFCDSVYRYSGYPCPRVGAFSNSVADYGLSFFDCRSATSTYTITGSRLLKSS